MKIAISICETSETLPECNGEMGVVGFCLCGLMTYRKAARTLVDATVAYYGGGAQNYLSEARDIRAPMIMHLGTEDEYISKDAQAAIKGAFASHKNVTVNSYAGCSHAFARHLGDATAAALANQRASAFSHHYLD